MGTVREHIRIDRSADDVWKVVSDAGAISTWFPGIESSSAEGSVRRCTLGNGAELVEEIVTSDDSLRRFQYRITEGPMPVEHHLATVDVIEDGDGALVIYGCDIVPHAGADLMRPAFAAGLQSLKAKLEEG